MAAINATLAKKGHQWHFGMKADIGVDADSGPVLSVLGTALLEQTEKLKASLRAKVEHRFRVIKRQFGHTNVGYRELSKNTAQLLTLFALSKVWMVRKRLLNAAQG